MKVGTRVQSKNVRIVSRNREFGRVASKVKRKNGEGWVIVLWGDINPSKVLWPVTELVEVTDKEYFLHKLTYGVK